MVLIIYKANCHVNEEKNVFFFEILLYSQEKIAQLPNDHDFVRFG